MKKRVKLISLLLIILTIFSITLTGCSNKQSNQLVVKINNKEIYLDEAMYYVLMYEANFSMMVGPDKWDEEMVDGDSLSSLVKTSIMDAMVENEILYEKGLEAGVEITADLESQFKASSIEFFGLLEDELLDITGIDETVLYNINKKTYVANLHKNNIVMGLDIDIDALVAEVKEDDYKQYSAEHLAISFASYDEEGNLVELTDAEKATAKDTMDKALKDVKDGKTFKEISEKYEDITLSPSSFVYDETTDDVYQKEAIKLEKDEVSEEVIETETGYFIIKMIDPDSKEAYNTAVNEAVAAKQQELYAVKYEEVKKDYTITINEDVWDPISVGHTTINLETQEAGPKETESKAEEDSAE